MIQNFVARSLSGSGYCVTWRRNDSLGSAGRWRVFAALCALSLGVAFAFAAFGAWLVLPYSVLEMGVLLWAFHWLERHAADWEKISVEGDRVVLERQSAGVMTRREFNRYWTRLEREAPIGRTPRLMLRYGSERLPFGDDWPAAELERVGRELRHVLAER